MDLLILLSRLPTLLLLPFSLPPTLPLQHPPNLINRPTNRPNPRPHQRPRDSNNPTYQNPQQIPQPHPQRPRCADPRRRALPPATGHDARLLALPAGFNLLVVGSLP